MHRQFQAVYVYIFDSENGSALNNKCFASCMKHLAEIACSFSSHSVYS